METPALPRRLAFTTGCNQLINWGISFYLPGTFARAISADRGWSAPQIYLGLTLAMLVMAAVSPFVARLLARFGGQKVVMGGTLLIAGLAIAIVRRPGRQTVSHCIPRDALTNGYKTPPPANISDT